ncbi:MAG TPA: serine acetyltransferase [Bdellovibrionales bacterium]|nr:serine acetyltransferase [Bdellovibrionales bacterium]
MLRKSFKTPAQIEVLLEDHFASLKKFLKVLGETPNHIDEIVQSYSQQLLTMSASVSKDADALLAGDPAASNIEEVLLCYPGLFAVAAHRISHFFYKKSNNIFARLMSEIAHEKTGIDIHPGAQIGDSFCIDHGTGVVIGETAIIGNHVKVYQGVTLGALSVDKANSKTKRHPTIEDHCVIYSHATILGGDTVIGQSSVIGGNVWMTKSVPAYSLVYHKSEVKLDQKKQMSEQQELHYEI